MKTMWNSRLGKKALAIIVTLFGCILLTNAGRYPCTDLSVIQIFKRSSYDFSIGVLDRVKEDVEGNFVLSPLQTWLQLTALAEGASGSTAREITKATRYQQQQLCFRQKFLEILKQNYANLGQNYRSSDIMVVNRDLQLISLYDLRINADEDYNIQLIPYDEDDTEVANYLNELIAEDTDGEIDDVFSPDDFLKGLVGGSAAKPLLVADAAYFNPVWSNPFDPYETSPQTFYSETNEAIAKVAMMRQTGIFNMSNIPFIDATVLELPCGQSKVSMLIFLPNEGSVENTYLLLKRVTLMTIFNKFSNEGTKRVHVRIPRFKINTDFDNFREIMSDMGIISVFEDWAELNRITDHPAHVSLMTQASVIEVTEGYYRATVNSGVTSGDQVLDFVANKPFAFMIVHRDTQIILLSGAYTTPSIY